jgi:hypothetical protein
MNKKKKIGDKRHIYGTELKKLTRMKEGDKQISGV